MAKGPTPDPIAAGLTATERVLLFCVATDTDWRKVVAVGAAQHMLIRGLIEREGSADRFTLTEQGRTVLETLMMKAAARGQ
jgi:hypothetical protein